MRNGSKKCEQPLVGNSATDFRLAFIRSGHLLLRAFPNVIPKHESTSQQRAVPQPWRIFTVRGGRDTAFFFLISAAITLVMFWPAVVGTKIFVPADVAPHLFSKFHYVDPTAKGVPANHYVIDMILGDISRNQLVHEAWRRGEMPWWDPYTDSGKPLAAEANAVNVSDPWKVLIFRLLPFEAAYNWIRILPFLISGLSAFWWLRYLQFSLAPSIWGGLLFQFAGCNAMMFSGPTVQASFAYYPLLWILWDRGLAEAKWLWFVASSLLAALVFLSGNLQSHTYLFLFAIAFCFGYGWRKRSRWLPLFGGIALALALGLCLAAPFVLSQVELFILNVRTIHPETSPLDMLTGVASIVGFFPWLFGTFRTLDLSKVFAQSGLGFWIYIGSAAMVIATMGLCTRTKSDSSNADIKRTGLALLAVYFIVCSTPLLHILYIRTAWIPVMALIIFFALGWTQLASNRGAYRRWGWATICSAVLIALAVNIGGFVVYPKFQSRIEDRVLQKEQTNKYLAPSPDLRKFQVANWTNEVTFKNPETAIAFAGLIALGLILVRPPPQPRPWLHATLVVSTIPLLLFVHRYIPMQPLARWESVRSGGPEQRRVIEKIGPEKLRLFENAPSGHDFVFPGAMAQLFKAHVMHGHSSLILRHAGFKDEEGAISPSLYDYEYVSSKRGEEIGDLLARTNGPLARFHWSPPLGRKISIVSETLCSLTLAVAPGPAGDLIRTDTYYPGWKISPPIEGTTFQFEPPCFARLHVPAEVTQLRIEYTPRFLRLGIAFAGGAAVLIAVLMATLVKRARVRAHLVSAI